jgi:hypothetical protein
MTKHKKIVRIIENSFPGYIASKILKSKNAAIVIGSTIYLHRTSFPDFVENKKWLLHELKHVEQYETEGILLFLWKYIRYVVMYGYTNNPYEIEARASENDESLLLKYQIVV